MSFTMSNAYVIYTMADHLGYYLTNNVAIPLDPQGHLWQKRLVLMTSITLKPYTSHWRERKSLG